MKKLTIFTLALCIVFALAACGVGDELPATGTYVVDEGYDTSEGLPQLKPFITLNAEEGRFTFTYDPLSSYANIGHFTVEGDVVTAVTDDGEYTFLFRIEGEDRVSFIADGSSELKLVDESLVIPVLDGTVFEKVTQE